ncbi:MULTISPECIES: hypothetical protein [Halorussus]|uniref:hypothetical protein n=1 Tax=Halorussus TaxID=1070314 RepID=UPI00209F31D8|nr:hypothetical protein [Halorussus vallis]USZ74074.1 hypothetical protein NGM07_11470 [Halorussus vallis]
MSKPESTETYTTVIKTIQGEKSAFGTAPDEIFVDLPVNRPNYVRVRKGQLLQEGDVLSKGDAEKAKGSEMRSAALGKWEVVEITPDTVRGRTLDGDAEETWDREWVEQRLATGGMSTDLITFDRISIHRIGNDESGSDGQEDAERADEPRLVVLTYGDNGRKFGRTYRFAGRDAETDVELVRADPLPEGVDADVRERFDARVQEALDRDGYRVRD